jgi:acyl-CoA reductase-like NAD-dependent aldehyde dehydrogenase
MVRMTTAAGTRVPWTPRGLPIGRGVREDVATAPVVFPFDGSVVAHAPVGDPAHADAALEAGTAALGPAAALTAAARRAILLQVERDLTAHGDDLVDLLVLETGKTVADCRLELDRTLFTWAASAEEVGHIHGETVPLDLQESGRGLVGFWVRKPIGLVVGITGFNAPLLLASHKIAAALAAGCPVICKPAPATPLATLWLADLVRRAAVDHGAPPEIVQVVTGDAEVGSRLVSDPQVAAVSFTGSAAVGHRIARAAAPRKTLLELGSNSALVVDSDADLDAAADAVIRGGFYFNGQACIAVQRVIALDPVVAGLVERIRARMGELVVGDPRDPDTRIAPLIDEASTARVLSWIEEAERAGATIVHGGGATGRAVRPTVLLDVPDEALAWREEIFAPVVAVRTAPDIETAFAMVNESRYGLQAAVFTRSLATAFRALDALDVGGVVVNEVPGFRSDVMPYGGVKDSGTGREGPRFAIDELTVTRMLVVRPS